MRKKVNSHNTIKSSSSSNTLLPNTVAGKYVVTRKTINMTLKGKRVQLFDHFLSHILVPLQDSMHPYKET